MALGLALAPPQALVLLDDVDPNPSPNPSPNPTPNQVPPQALVLLEDVDVAFVQREANDRRVGVSFSGWARVGPRLLNAQPSPDPTLTHNPTLR